MTIRDHAPKTKDKSFDRDEWQTPPELFAKWNSKFKFTVDAASSGSNKQLPTHWTKRSNGLAQSWGKHRVWCNPPYSDITPWVEKASSFEADLAVLLVPAWTDRKWFQAIIKIGKESGPWSEGRVSIDFLPGRIKFLKNGKPSDSAPFPSCLIIFGRLS